MEVVKRIKKLAKCGKVKLHFIDTYPFANVGDDIVWFKLCCCFHFINRILWIFQSSVSKIFYMDLKVLILIIVIIMALNLWLLTSFFGFMCLLSKWGASFSSIMMWVLCSPNFTHVSSMIDCEETAKANFGEAEINRW